MIELSRTAQQFARALDRAQEGDPRRMVWRGLFGWWSYDGHRIRDHRTWHGAMRAVA